MFWIRLVIIIHPSASSCPWTTTRQSQHESHTHNAHNGKAMLTELSGAPLRGAPDDWRCPALQAATASSQSVSVVSW